jgi:predicted  nucleic acid-binding Zn-ribbon protein
MDKALSQLNSNNDTNFLKKREERTNEATQSNKNELSTFSDLQNQYNDASSKLDSIGKNTQDLKGAFQRGYDAEMDKQSSINSQTNNMSGNGKVTILGMKVRHGNIQHSQNPEFV